MISISIQKVLDKAFKSDAEKRICFDVLLLKSNKQWRLSGSIVKGGQEQKSVGYLRKSNLEQKVVINYSFEEDDLGVNNNYYQTVN